jgi:opine dehydrogenase
VTNITVIGAGGTGHTLTADLSLFGYNVTLYEEPEFKDKLRDVIERNSIELTGAIGQGIAKVTGITTDIQKALKDAEIILVATRANRHEVIAEKCAPYLKNGQIIVIAPDNGGTLTFAQVFKKANLNRKVYISGMSGNYYPCRLIGPAKVVVALPRSAKRLAAFPGKDTAHVLRELTRLEKVHKFSAGTNALEMALSAMNLAIHLAASILNTGAIENSGGQYYLYQKGITPSIVKCIDAVARERIELFKVMGYNQISDNIVQKIPKRAEYPELDLFRGLIGPTSMQHRYITEDAPTAQTLMVSLGEQVNVSTPVTRSLVILASILNQADFLKTGRTMEKLGLSGMTVSELNRFLENG